MRKAALFSLGLLALPTIALPTAAAAKPPVVVELYTAQGCASCGEANAYVAKLADRPNVIALTFSVDYWDYLGWADTFAKPEFDERQKAYVAKLALREPYTPQVVVDGTAQAAGTRTDRIDKLVAEAARQRRDPPQIHFVEDKRVYVGSARAPKGGGEVWLVRYDPRQQDVAVKSGDNKGQTIPSRNVVRELKRLGAWRGKPVAFRLPPADEGLKTVVILQAGRGGRVLAADEPKS